MSKDLGKSVRVLHGGYSICEVLKDGKVVGYALVAPGGRWLKEGSIDECQLHFDNLNMSDEPNIEPPSFGH